jgi:hypothetical protein
LRGSNYCVEASENVGKVGPFSGVDTNHIGLWELWLPFGPQSPTVFDFLQNMTVRFPVRLVRAGVWLFFILHFVLLFWYQWPSDSQFDRKARPTARYAEPTFYQQWSLFAPDVNAYQVRMTYAAKSGNSDWTERLSPADSPHRVHRSAMRRMHQSMVHELGDFAARNWYVADSVLVLDAIIENHLFHGAVYLCAKHRVLTSGERPDSLQIFLRYRYLSPPGNPADDEVYELKFPPISPFR